MQQQSRQQDFFLREGDDDEKRLAMRCGEEEDGGQNEAGENDNENDFSLFLEEVSDEVSPPLPLLVSDAERFWGASAAPEVVIAAIERFMAEFAEGLLRGQLADIELVRVLREREGERERKTTDDDRRKFHPFLQKQKKQNKKQEPRNRFVSFSFLFNHHHRPLPLLSAALPLLLALAPARPARLQAPSDPRCRARGPDNAENHDNSRPLLPPQGRRRRRCKKGLGRLGGGRRRAGAAGAAEGGSGLEGGAEGRRGGLPLGRQ